MSGSLYIAQSHCQQGGEEHALQKYGKDVEWLIKDVEESLQIYFSFKFLRVLQKENSKKVKEILNYLLENAIIYFDPQFADVYKKYEFDMQEEFVKLAKGLNVLVDYYISRHYTRTAMLRDLEEETGLDRELCQYISEKIWENYQMLQMELVINLIQQKDAD